MIYLSRQGLISLVLLALAASALGAGSGTDPSFAVATPESQGIAQAALDSLARVVQRYIGDDEIVGAELLIIKNRRTIFHRGFGWKDRDGKIPMAENTVFNIRSMTKPITGAGIQMLVDQGRLKLEDRAATYLPAFGSGSSASVTIEQLLEHRSGLPLTVMKDTADLSRYPDLVAMADGIGEAGTEFEPASRFWYSDAGSDVLGAITEIVSGIPLDQFRKQSLLDPLGMRDTFTLSRRDTSRAGDVASLYVGGAGNWRRYWKPGDAPLYPYAWGSQTLYSTPMDYAKFLAMWMDNGKVGNKELLSKRAIESTLEPVSRMGLLGMDGNFPTAFPQHEVYYGRMAMLYVDTRRPDTARPAVIGHHGSDGTYAWAWPEIDLMVLYFTQSRGEATGGKLERDIYHLLVSPEEAAAEVEAPGEFAPLLGKYTASVGTLPDAEYTVLARDGRLALDIPGQMLFELKEPDQEGVRHFLVTDLLGVSFDADTTGEITALRIHETTPMERAPDQPDSLRLGAPEDYLPYVGRYFVGPIRREVDVRVVGGKLAVDFRPEGIVTLVDPNNRDGRWPIEGRSAAWIMFLKDDSGRVSAMNLLRVTRVPRGKCSACLVEKVMRESGIERAIQAYREIRANQADEYIFHERGLNAVGYRLLSEDRVDDAIEIFKLNVDEYPGAFNAYDSLGEAYLKKGDRESAVRNYQKSLELNPNNENAKRMLEQLKQGN